MPVARVHKTDDFTVMANHHLRNHELSCKSAGLLSRILSLPDDWDYSIQGLESILPEGRDAIRSMLQELERFKYLVRTKSRDPASGQYVWVYEFYEEPQFEPQTGFQGMANESSKKPQFEPRSDKPYMDSPYMENPSMALSGEDTKKAQFEPHTGSPSMENPTQLNTKDIDKDSNKSKSKSYQVDTPSLDELKRFVKERNLNFIDPSEIFGYYEGMGWTTKSGAAIKDWKRLLIRINENNHRQAAKRASEANSEYRANWSEADIIDYEALNDQCSKLYDRKQREEVSVGD